MSQVLRSRASIWWMVCGLLLLVVALWAQGYVGAEDREATSRSTRSNRAHSLSAAPSAAQADSLEAMLQQVIENQERMLERLDEVMEELRIVKVRATLRGN